ncbi:hypothetical protein CEXT_654481 [Caerostris extrusa]|uniref:Uncharacterized protein n=1 Tax=Caerostris extrusa TaxID=172846 RepID=A0AAV4WXJ4_CAEEX|nr:hypothetical protein CEXT_654481 [Caerostris extrusa]
MYYRADFFLLNGGWMYQSRIFRSASSKNPACLPSLTHLGISGFQLRKAGGLIGDGQPPTGSIARINARFLKRGTGNLPSPRGFLPPIPPQAIWEQSSLR